MNADDFATSAGTEKAGNRIIVVGAGPGAPSQLTRAAEDAVRGCRCAVAAERHAWMAEGCGKIIILRGFDDTFSEMERELEKGDVAVIVSGDPGIYSLMPLLKKRFPERRVEAVPGISSLQSLCAEAAERWDDAKILSGHGRGISGAKVLSTVDCSRATIFFCGTDKTPRWFCRLLAENGLDGVEITVGERLSYGDKKIVRGRPSEVAEKEFGPLSIVLAVNPSPSEAPQALPCDSDFIREKDIPMTREEVRAVILAKLGLSRASVLWDIGSGTGSISAAAAALCPDGEVCAVEIAPAAAELSVRNMKKLRAYNVRVHVGAALETVDALPAPTHIFVGGSGRELPELLEKIASMEAGIKVVVSAVTLKTYSIASEALSGPGFSGFDAVQINVSRMKKIGESAIMAAQNPVTIFSAVTRGAHREGKA